VDFSSRNKLLEHNWIFKTKIKVANIDKYKVRLVVKYFRQQDVDYFDTYSILLRITSTKMFTAIITIKKFEIHQMGIEIIF
jgi:hypothetical protein